MSVREVEINTIGLIYILSRDQDQSRSQVSLPCFSSFKFSCFRNIVNSYSSSRTNLDLCSDHSPWFTCKSKLCFNLSPRQNRYSTRSLFVLEGVSWSNPVKTAKLYYNWKANPSQSLNLRVKPNMAEIEEFGRQFQSPRWSL